MKTRKEFRKVKQIIHAFESFQYPGYPYSHFGVVDFKTKDCWDSNGRKKFIADDNWYKFAAQFEAGMLYHILDSDFDRKGSFIQDSDMKDYKTFLEEKWSEQVEKASGEKVTIEHFFIDNQELVRLYFAVYAAIRKYDNTDKVMLYIYDGGEDYVDVQIFDNLEEINNYYKQSRGE